MPDQQPLFPLPSEGANGVNSRDLIELCFKYWLTVTVCFILVSLLTWGVIYLQPPIYEATAKVWIKTDQQGTPSFLSGIAAYRESQIPEPATRRVETEIQLLLSRSNAETVVQNLAINKKQLLDTPISYLLVYLPTWTKKPPLTAEAVRHSTAALLVKGISVEALRSKTADTTSNVLEVTFRCADKSLAPHALAALLDEYVAFGSQQNRELGAAAYRLVDAKLSQEDADLKSLDADILALTVTEDSRADVSVPAVSSTASQNNASSSLSLMKTQSIEMQAKLEEAQQLYPEDSPHVGHLRDQLDSLRQRLREGVRRSAELDGNLQKLERQRSLTLARFSELRTKRDQIELYLQLNPVQSDSRVITETPVEPEKPQRKVRLILGALGAFAGLSLGLLIASLREYLDHRLRNAADVKHYLGLDTLGTFPRMHS